MKIRPVIKKDIPQIVKLITEVWAEYDCVLDTETDEKYLLAPGDYFRARGGEFWVAEESGEIIATVAVMFNDAETAELKSLYVRRAFRKQGLGESLIELVIKFARKKGAGEIVLWSDTRFTKAHRLYERMNFRNCGMRELFDLNNSIEFNFGLNLD